MADVMISNERRRSDALENSRVRREQCVHRRSGEDRGQLRSPIIIPSDRRHLEISFLHSGFSAISGKMYVSPEQIRPFPFQHFNTQFDPKLMSTTDVAHNGVAVPSPSSSTSKARLRWGIALVLFAAISAAVGAFLCIKFWPFSQKEVIENLAAFSDSSVSIQGYHPTYFPVPGCVLYGVEFRHGSAPAPLITIQKLRIMGSFSGIPWQHVPRVTAEGTHVLIPPIGGNAPFHPGKVKLRVGELVADGAVIEIASNEPHEPPLRFDIREAQLNEVGLRSAIRYRIKFHSPNPPGEIFATGRFGPWSDRDPENTPLSGGYNYTDANLVIYDGIAGIMSSDGKFDGTLKHIDVLGSTDVPAFELKSSGHEVHLQTKFDAWVDGSNGDIFLKRVEAKLGRTTVVAEGRIADSDGSKGKTAKFHLSSRDGRIEDILNLFVTSPVAPMVGAISFDGESEIYNGDSPFLDRIRLAGTFAIDQAEFTAGDTQGEVDKLSAGAQGKKKDDPATALTTLKGNVQLAHSIANLSDVDLRIPGAHALLHGTFNVINYRIDLHGKMRVETRISKTESGLKAVILKVMDPIFKKKRTGEIVPVRITGTYEKPEFGLDLTKQASTTPSSE